MNRPLKIMIAMLFSALIGGILVNLGEIGVSDYLVIVVAVGLIAWLVTE